MSEIEILKGSSEFPDAVEMLRNQVISSLFRNPPVVTEEDERQHRLSMIRTQLRAGLIVHPDWPPPQHWPEANKLLHLDRLAERLERGES
jgi:hypothetical protein